MSHLFDHFPREVDMRLRKVVKSMEELQSYVSSMNGKDNLTTTVYGFKELKPNRTRCEYSTAIVPHFVIDLDKGRAKEMMDIDDHEAGERCTIDTHNLVKHLNDNDLRHATWFSGGGYHVWVMLDTIHDVSAMELNDLLFSGRAMLNKWIKDMDLITVDPVVSFRPDRHIRIPNTFNFKRGLWSIPVNQSDLATGWDSITKMATKASSGMKVSGTKGVHIDIVHRDPGNPFMLNNTAMKFDSDDITISASSVSGIPMLPCIEASACVKGSNPSHMPRVYLLMYLLDYFRKFARPPSSTEVPPSEILNKTHSFIHELDWSDYKPDVTRKMIMHGMSREYMTPTCPTLYGQGLCVGKCPFYDGKGGIS
ncbi:MAG: hypothetical protein ACPF9I_05760 [Candidatus Thalassarchaeaceae archaeon]